MAQTKIEQGLLKFTEATDYLKIPTGTTAQRPSSPSAGYIRFNTTISAVETYDGTKWVEIGLNPPTFSSVDYPGSATALDPAGGESLVINGDTFNVGITVTIGGTTPSSITRNSATQLTVTTPAKTAGTYDIVFTNTDGGTATATNAVSYNGIPAFTNAAGSLGSVEENSTVSLSAAATEPDGGTITYAITSGSLPSGLSLNSSTGAITGTAPNVSADTTSNFTVTATDNENQTASRAYSITVTNLSPSSSFNTVLYNGTSATHAITGLGFEPDLVWIKDRGNPEQHILNDSTRGAGNDLSSNTNGAQANRPTGFLSFDSDGFTLGTDGGGVVNDSTRGPYVAWCWKVNGGTTSSNTDGTITSTVQVNQNAGISIVEYTGNGNTSQQSFGHGLSSTPQLIIQKSIDTLTVGTNNWLLGGSAIGTAGQWLELNTTDPLQTSTNYWGNQLPNSSVVYISGTSALVHNENAKRFINYCFVEKAGYSKFGSYTGNGSTDGPIVETGFEPAFLMIKRTDITGHHWNIWDNKRTPAGEKVLYANLTNAESSYGYINFLSNGFQHTRTNAGINANGGTYIYMAFAADPDTTSPTLADSFSTVTYTGGALGSSYPVTGLGFQPNLVWIKCRDTAHNHYIVDSIRGADKVIASNLSNADPAFTPDEFGSFDSDGFTLTPTSGGGRTAYSANGPYVAWAWKADDALPTINTNGSINSIVSANANAGVSIVSYTGNGVQGATVAHGLGSAPDMIIIKDLSSTEVWLVGNSESGWTKAMHLNLTNADNASNLYWDDTAPTSSVFSIGAFGTSYNVNGNKYIAYCFKSTSGFSKIGSYSGGSIGSSNAITTGFQPDWIMIKRTDAADDWTIIDSVRGDSASSRRIIANTSEVEKAATSIWFPTSTGFYFSGTGASYNASGGTYIYASFKIN